MRQALLDEVAALKRDDRIALLALDPACTMLRCAISAMYLHEATR